MNLQNELYDFLVDILLETILLLEFGNEKIADQDSAIEILESIAHRIQKLDKDTQSYLIKSIKLKSPKYNKEIQEYIKNIEENFGF